MNAATEPKVRIEVQVTRADGTVEPMQVITNEGTPGWSVRLKKLLKGN